MSRELTLEERKEIGMEILDEIKRICDELEITFYLAYGTLLGAVRHSLISGFFEVIMKN